MKHICILLFLLSTVANAQVGQVKVFGEYSTPELLANTGENKNLDYYWLYQSDTIFMNFPTTVLGMANLYDKLNYILLLNKLDPKTPSWNKSVFQLGVKSDGSYSNVAEIVARGDAAISQGWILGTHELVIFIVKSGYQIRVQEYKPN